MLPGVNIPFVNGALGSVEPSADGVVGMIAHATAVGSTFALNTPYVVTSMEDVAALGIIPNLANAKLYYKLERFFAQAQPKKTLWLYGTGNTLTMQEWFILDNGTCPFFKLLDAANGDINFVMTCFNPDNSFGAAVENGLDETVWGAMAEAQLRCQEYTTNKYAPVFVILEGISYNGNEEDLPDLTENDYNRVALVIGDVTYTEDYTTGAAVELLAGRLAATPVNQNPGRKKSGALIASEIFLRDKTPEQANIGMLHDKGFITFRKHIGSAGYYFTDSPLATAVSDDYRFIERRRTIDKAYRIAYAQGLETVLDDFDVNSNGTIDRAFAKSIEGQIESAIFNQMTINGELSRDKSDPNDKGVICRIDLTHNVTSTSKIKFLGLQVKPKGVARYLDVPLGFVPVTNN